jgi:hypothetical protein
MIRSRLAPNKHAPSVFDVNAVQPGFASTLKMFVGIIMKTVMPGTGIVASGEISLKRVFSHF